MAKGSTVVAKMARMLCVISGYDKESEASILTAGERASLKMERFLGE